MERTATLSTQELGSFYALHKPGDVHYAYIPHTCGHVWIEDYQLMYVQETTRKPVTWWKRLLLCNMDKGPFYVRFKPAHHRVRLVYDKAFVSCVQQDPEQNEAYTYAPVPQWTFHVHMAKVPTGQRGYGFVDIKDIPAHVCKLVFKLH